MMAMIILGNRDDDDAGGLPRKEREDGTDDDRRSCCVLCFSVEKAAERFRSLQHVGESAPSTVVREASRSPLAILMDISM